jgi:general secretion pathway protein D
MKTVVKNLIVLLLAAVSVLSVRSQVPAPTTTNKPAPSSFFGASTNFARFPRTNLTPAVNTAVPVTPGTATPAAPINPVTGQVRPGGVSPLTPGAAAGPNTNAPFVATNLVQRGNTNDIPAKMMAFQEADVSQVLEVYAILTGKTLLRSPQVPMTAKITVRNETALTHQEGIDALNTILGLNGIAMIPEGEKFIKVIPEGGVANAATPFSTNLVDLRPSMTPVAQIYILKNLTPEDANSILTPYAKLPNSIVGVRGSPVLVLRDYAENVQRMLEILEKVDVALPMDIETVVIPIRYALAGEIAGVLSGLGASTGSGLAGGGASGGGFSGGTGGGLGTSGFGGGAGTFNRGGIGAGSYGAGGYQPGVGTGGGQFGGRTGVGAFGGATTTPGGIGTASPGGFGGRTQFGQRLSSAVGRAVGAAGGAPGEFVLIEQAKIIPDDRSNSLLVFADHRSLVMISNIISKLDVVLPQVLIEALIMEVKLDDGKSLGVTMSQNKQKAGDLTFAGISPNGPSFLDPRNLTSLGSFTSNAVGAGGLSYFGKLNDDFDVAVNATANDSRINVLSRPHITTSTAKPASIFIGETRPYVTGSYFSDFSGGGSRSQYAQTQIGISLNVYPIVNQDGLVVMDIQQHISQVGNNVKIDGNDVPTTIDRDANAYVAVNNRDTILLGGFISTTKNKSNSGVPFLKDIPGLGLLFRNSSENISRGELMVLIRPTVLPTPEAAALETAARKDKLPNIKHAERDEEEFARKLLEKERKAEEKAERRGK